jgi:hypothetical protein
VMRSRAISLESVATGPAGMRCNSGAGQPVE